MFISTCLDCYDGSDGEITTVVRVSDDDGEICEKCGQRKHYVHTDGFINMCLPGDYNFASESLAMNPSQISTHKKLFPDVDVTPDGRPCFNSVKQRERYNEKIGMVKRPQKIRNRGKRIA